MHNSFVKVIWQISTSVTTYLGISRKIIYSPLFISLLILFVFSFALQENSNTWRMLIWISTKLNIFISKSQIVW